MTADELIGTVYLIHLDTPLHHARHYIGFARELDKRMYHHRHGTGARMLKACNERGITYQVARTWENTPQAFEYTLKRRKDSDFYCPFCRAAKLEATNEHQV